MVATTMIGNVSAVPPEARHAKRLLGLLGGGGKTPALAGRALLSAVAAVDVTLPPNPSVDGRGDGDCGGDGGGEDAAVMEAVRAALERRRGGSAAAAGPGPVPAPAEDPLRLRASSAAAATLRDGLARAVRSLVEADERARAAGEKGRERIEERLGMALWRGIGRAVDAGTAVLGGEGDPDAPSDEEGDGGSGGMDAAAPKRKGRGGDGESSGGSKRPRTAGGGTGDPPATAPGEGWERTAAIRRTASHCLEALHLEVASRSPRVWGRRKIYEVYCMPRPVRTVGRGDGALKSVRDAVEREFRSSFHGGGEDQSGVRVYVLLRRVVPKLWGKEAKGSRGDLGGEGADPNGEEEDSAGTYLFVHLCIGKPLDMNDESNRSRSGEKKKKMGNEFVAIMRPGSTLFALTASRAPSRSYRTPFVLAALVTALGSNAGDCLGHSAERVGDGAGTEPFELLEAASAATYGTAVGRFASYSQRGVGGRGGEDAGGTEMGDPLVEIDRASTDALLGREAERGRLETGAIHGRNIANLAGNVASIGGGTSALVASNQAGLIVDHDAVSRREMERAGDNDFGAGGSCPRSDRVCWKWTGETSAAWRCWREDAQAFGLEDEEASTEASTRFKCGVVMEGSDVFGGLRALIASGVAKAPLPDYVRDAPGARTKTITVSNGAFAAADCLAAV